MQTPDHERLFSYDDLERHYEAQLKQFHIPVYIDPASTDPERQLRFRSYNNQHTSRLLSELTPDDCKAFCWKDWAIYANAGIMIRDHMDLLEEVYQQWWPHRARDKDISDGNFFGKLMRFVPAVEKLEEIARFHRSLCEVLERLQPLVPDRETFAPYAVKKDGKRRFGAYELRPLFSSVFIAVDAGWKERGVLLVCNTASTARELSIEEGRDGISVYEAHDGSNLGDACVFRCTLRRAMKIVVSQDADRARKQREYNESYDEVYGSE